MLYFSELKGKKAYTDNHKYIGRLTDVIFRAQETPNITKLVLRKQDGTDEMVPIEYLDEIKNDVVVMKKDFVPSQLSENELFLVRNLLDKQIIDVEGNKVVRVNDVAIQDKDERKSYYIAGVDIGLRGILRWFHLEHATEPIYKLLRMQDHPHFLSWSQIQPLELAAGKVKLKMRQEKLSRIHPEELADYLEQTTIRNVRSILDTLDKNTAANVISNLNINYQQAIFKRFSPQKAATIIEIIDSDEAVDILSSLSMARREEILQLVSFEKRNELVELLSISKTPIGGIIFPDYLSISLENTIKSAKGAITKQITKKTFSDYVYVVNSQCQLIGVFGLNELFLYKDVTPIVEVIEQDVEVLHLSTPKEIALKKMLRFKVIALPVISAHKKILGVVRIDDLTNDILEHL